MISQGTGATRNYLSKPRRLALVATLLAAALIGCLLSSCSKFERKVVVVASPETVAPEINGARWPQTSIPVHYCLDPDNGYIGGDVVLQLLAKAFSTWGVPTKSDGTCSGPASTDDGRNEISWAGLSQPGSGLTEAGKTSLRYRIPSRGTAQIIEADIELDNNTPRSRRDKECLYTTILHETGHFLGLHHLGSGTIMAPVVTECAQDLTPEDKQALSELY